MPRRDLSSGMKICNPVHHSAVIAEEKRKWGSPVRRAESEEVEAPVGAYGRDLSRTAVIVG